MRSVKRWSIGAAVCALVTAQAWAGLTADEIKRLGADLTPWGAEKAGNKDGSIPPYTGGVDPKAFKVTVVGKKENGIEWKKYSDPFAADKPLYSINASSMDKYADKLDEATKLMLKRYPNTYRIDVYPTRRSAVYPKFVVDNTLLNAQTAVLESEGLGLTGAYGGIPFPIPKTGNEVIWNWTLRNLGRLTSSGKQETWYVDSSGTRILANAGTNHTESPYYDPNIGRENYLKQNNPPIILINGSYSSPARMAGNENVYNERIGKVYERKAWSYVQGQRRVRVAPDLAYDTPIVQNGGVLVFDDSGLFWGAMDRFDFKLIGKKEMYIPYNTYKEMYWTPAEVAAGKNHQNPDTARWELHRVWVVESTLKPGFRHLYSKRVYLIDEDYAGGLQYSYDAAGKLYRSIQSVSNPLPEGVNSSQGYWAYDFVAGVYGRVTQNSCADCGSWAETTKGLGASYYTPEAMQTRGVR